jgi:outer membrane receptor for ferrienterochelin and colicins
MKTVKYIIVIFVLMAVNSTVFAENKGDKVPKTVTLSGKVIDKTNQEALAGALIRIEGTELKVYTDLDGNFSISGLVPDTYKVKCSMISYSDREEEIKVGQKAGDVEISLQSVGAEQVSR